MQLKYNEFIKQGTNLRCIDPGAGSWLTLGNVYTVTRDSPISDDLVDMVDNGGQNNKFYKNRFELVSIPSDLDSEIELAKSFLNKELVVKGGTTPFTPTSFVAFTSEVPKYFQSVMVMDFFKENGWAVAMLESSQCIPVSRLDLAPEFEEFKLNDTYTAKIFRDKVEVGCQTFDVSVIKELNKLIEKNNY